MTNQEYEALCGAYRNAKALRDQIHGLDSFIRGIMSRKGQELRLSIYSLSSDPRDRGCWATFAAETIRRTIVPALRAELARLRKFERSQSITVLYHENVE